MKKKDKVGDLTRPDFKTYYKITVTKMVWSYRIDRHIEQWNRIESPESKPLSIWPNELTLWEKDSLVNK